MFYLSNFIHLILNIEEKFPFYKDKVKKIKNKMYSGTVRKLRNKNYILTSLQYYI